MGHTFVNATITTMSIFSFLRIKKNAQRRNPPQGYVDLVYNPSTGQLAVRESDGSVDPLGGSSGPVEGVTDGSDAASGVVGEYLREHEDGPTTPGSEANFVSIELSAGDWDVVGGVSYIAFGATANGFINVEVTSESSSFDLNADGFSQWTVRSGNQTVKIVSCPVRFSVTETTTVYLRIGQQATASGQTFSNGFLRARRVR